MLDIERLTNGQIKYKNEIGEKLAEEVQRPLSTIGGNKVNTVLINTYEVVKEMKKKNETNPLF